MLFINLNSRWSEQLITVMYYAKRCLTTTFLLKSLNFLPCVWNENFIKSLKLKVENGAWISFLFIMSLNFIEMALWWTLKKSEKILYYEFEINIYVDPMVFLRMSIISALRMWKINLWDEIKISFWNREMLVKPCISLPYEHFNLLFFNLKRHFYTSFLKKGYFYGGDFAFPELYSREVYFFSSDYSIVQIIRHNVEDDNKIALSCNERWNRETTQTFCWKPPNI